MKPIKLRMTGIQHDRLRHHLFPGDENEAVAVAVCGRRRGQSAHTILVHEIHPIPYDECAVRAPDRIVWSTRAVLPLLERAARDNLAILKIHSHPGGYPQFSVIDDASDADFFASVYGWIDSDDPHVSAVMLPGGRTFARSIATSGEFSPVQLVAVTGDDLDFWHSGDAQSESPDFAQRHAQLFGAETIRRLTRLSVAVVGCSGTGSPVVEMLARLGIGGLVLVDPDRVEEKNLNRILNATREDAILKRPKVEVLGRAVARMGLGTKVTLMSKNVATPEAVAAVAECDVLFGCVDGAFGRNVLNRIATFYSLPYFDIGVALDSDGIGGIDEACGAVHYIQPDRSSLRDRKVYTAQQVQAEGLRMTNPDEYQRRVQEKYIRGVQEDRPAVISINMQMAATAVNEFLARLHPYRYATNEEFSTVRTSFIQGEHYRESDRIPVPALARQAGRGDVTPLLDMPAIQASQTP